MPQSQACIFCVSSYFLIHIDGKVTCLEAGCNAESFLLGQNIKIPDGGKRDGIGSLANYRVSIMTYSDQSIVLITYRVFPTVSHCQSPNSRESATSANSGKGRRGKYATGRSASTRSHIRLSVDSQHREARQSQQSQRRQEGALHESSGSSRCWDFVPVAQHRKE